MRRCLILGSALNWLSDVEAALSQASLRVSLLRSRQARSGAAGLTHGSRFILSILIAVIVLGSKLDCQLTLASSATKAASVSRTFWTIFTRHKNQVEVRDSSRVK